MPQQVFSILHSHSQLLLTCSEFFQPQSSKTIDYSAIHALENQADAIVIRMMKELESYYILPLDKEDIQDLIQAQDDIFDTIDRAFHRIDIFEVTIDTTIEEFFTQISKGITIIFQMTQQWATVRFETSHLKDTCAALQELEIVGDDIHRKGLRTLFTQEDDWKVLISTKEVYKFLEYTLDMIEKYAVILEKISLKYS